MSGTNRLAVLGILLCGLFGSAPARALCVDEGAEAIGSGCAAGVAFQGCCDGDIVVWCSQDGLETCRLTCPGGLYCGWDGAFYNCTPEPWTEDPSGQYPRQCPTDCVPQCGVRECGFDGCFGTCGICPAGLACHAEWFTCVSCVCEPNWQCGDTDCGTACGPGCATGEVCFDHTCYPDPCHGAPAEGCCLGDRAVQCNGAGYPWAMLQTFDCGGSGCGWSPADPPSGSYACGASGADPTGAFPQDCTAYCQPDCSGRQCGSDPVCGFASCGECPEGSFCTSAGQCNACTCGAGWQCGVDECGRSCGECAVEQYCDESHLCQAAPLCAVYGTVACGSVEVGHNADGIANVSTYACSPWHESGPELAYVLQVATPTRVAAALSDLESDLDLFVLEGACSGYRCIAHGDNDAIFDALPGATYFLAVDGYMGATGPFSLSVDCCQADCGGRECGLDPLCGLVCGECAAGATCVDGTCVTCGCPAYQECGFGPCGEICGSGCAAAEVCGPPGRCIAVPTCAAPLPLACGDRVVGSNASGSDGVDSYACSGWQETGPEVAFRLVAPGDIAMRARLSGLQADLDVFLLADQCAAANCTAFGDVEVFQRLEAGRSYYLSVDGYLDQVSDFVLDIECCTPNCAGRDCGIDSACGVLCGRCEAGYRCTAAGRCEQAPRCASRGALGCGEAIDDTTSLWDEDIVDEYPECGAASMDMAEVAYTFTSPTETLATVQLGGDPDLVLAVMADACSGHAPCLGFGSGGVTFRAEAGRTYYVIVDAADRSFFPQSFTLEAQCTPCGCESGWQCGFDMCGNRCGPGCAPAETCTAEHTCLAPAPFACLHSADVPSASGCAWASAAQGCCDDWGRVLFCGRDENTYCLDCAAFGQVCGWNEAERRYACGADPAPEPTGALPRACVFCAPDCTGRDCGPDGCGGDCGTCPADFFCADTGRCTAICAPDCTGRQCGPDGCGGECGTCGAGETCDTAGQCAVVCVPDCTGRECGPDGCGDECGTCPSGLRCDGAGQCTLECVPDCTGRPCGPDGCGGECGTCGAGETCDAASGQCSPGPAACLSDADCPDPFAPRCQVESGECVQCLGADDCTGDPERPVCDTAYGACVVCLADGDCAPGQICTAGHVCGLCRADGDCPDPATRHCEANTGQCVACLEDAHCSAGLVCAVGFVCGECRTDAECLAPGRPRCRTTDATCVACLLPSDCPGLCAADNTCVSCTGPGDCLVPERPHCAPDGACGGCLEAAHCAAGETCDPTSYTCVPGSGCTSAAECDPGAACVGGVCTADCRLPAANPCPAAAPCSRLTGACTAPPGDVEGPSPDGATPGDVQPPAGDVPSSDAGGGGGAGGGCGAGTGPHPGTAGFAFALGLWLWLCRARRPGRSPLSGRR